MRSWPSLTAEAVCLARALEHRRSDRLVDDPHAISFLRAPMRAMVHSARASGPLGNLAEFGLDPGFVASIAARHGHMDRAVTRELLAGADQLLLLGAGYDSRPWRLPVKDTLVVELDHPATARRKTRRLSRRGLNPQQRHAITADLAAEPLTDALARTPLRRDARSVVVWEGVTMYLHERDIVRTLDALRETLGPGTTLVCDLWSRTRYLLPLAAAEDLGRIGLSMLGEPIRFDIDPVRIPSWLARHGWRVTHHTDTDAVARSHAGRRAWPQLELVVAVA